MKSMRLSYYFSDSEVAILQKTSVFSNWKHPTLEYTCINSPVCIYSLYIPPLHNHLLLINIYPVTNTKYVDYLLSSSHFIRNTLTNTNIMTKPSLENNLVTIVTGPTRVILGGNWMFYEQLARETLWYVRRYTYGDVCWYAWQVTCTYQEQAPTMV
ncbi:Protein of unknown function [Pyronema omphalodes CBS 100304]|uniref:Uncharacterized protein n=1 Tax=Pyronema omphalodes (strain CBS 100304) TaxID=1076935 RepID=U4LNB6_PYROM|nr:Protein of unknown function [Pyronema omphalodes CBS 100304]